MLWVGILKECRKNLFQLTYACLKVLLTLEPSMFFGSSDLLNVQYLHFKHDNFQTAVIFKTEIGYQAETAPANTRSPVAEMKAAVHKAAKRLYLFF